MRGAGLRTTASRSSHPVAEFWANGGAGTRRRVAHVGTGRSYGQFPELGHPALRPALPTSLPPDSARIATSLIRCQRHPHLPLPFSLIKFSNHC